MSKIVIPYKPQPRQQVFHKAKADEILYGGAAGGGKSEATIFDALLYAVKYPGSRQIIFRRTYPDLQRSIIARTLQVYPKAIAKFNDQKKTWTFTNQSVIELAYWDSDSNYTNYQGAEYDVIRWEELTQFKEDWYLYMLSRNRGANDYPKSVKSTTNPGGIGHSWVKKRFVDIGQAEQVHHVPETDEDGVPLTWPPGTPNAGEPIIRSRVFIPATVHDNPALLAKDPGYIARLMSLPDAERKQLLEGDWDSFAGQYFSEFDRSIHVVKPFEIPHHWRKYRALDDGYSPDPFVCLWIALDEQGTAYIYRELQQTQLLSHQQVEKVKEMTPSDEEIDYTVADTQFWVKQRDSGQSSAEIFAQNGVPLIQATKDRINGWGRVRDWLHVYDDVDRVSGEKFKNSRLKIFSNCLKTIESIPAMVHDDKHPNDMAAHSLDHIPDAIRYWAMSRPEPKKPEPALPDTSMEAKVRRNIQNLSKRKRRTELL